MQRFSVSMVDQLKGATITFHWGEEQQQSFDKLKVVLATAPILAIVDPQNHLWLKRMQVLRQ